MRPISPKGHPGAQIRDNALSKARLNFVGKTSSISRSIRIRHGFHDETLPDNAAKVSHFCSMCGPHFCSMKITQDVREYAAQKQLDEQQRLELGMKEKSEEFRKAGAEIYR